MKNLILILFVTVVFTACKKNDDPAPDAATAVAGTYALTLFGQDTGDGTGYEEYELPVVSGGTTLLSGTMTASRDDANTITLAVSLKQAGQADDNQTLGQVTLQKSGSGYDMLDNSSKVGTIDGTNVLLDVSIPASGTLAAGRFVFKGKK
ncbi:hypothetical protein [Spirosoma sp.]|uniref:hypothetical protein n=1 Tax=Spirosoma sp. TaxID=1899569 RepID=UPI003B3B4223